MLRTQMGKILINEALPERLRSEDRVLDKQGLNDLLRDVAINHPDDYPEISHKLANIGRRVATETGGHTFGLAHIRKAKAGQKHEAAIRAKMTKILADNRMTDQQRNEAVIRAAGDVQEAQMKEVLQESIDEKNPLGMQVLSGARGNKMNLSSIRGSDLLYTDHRQRVIPVPVLRSYSQGLDPISYWAGTYGARQGVLSTKFAVQQSGFLSKQLNQTAHRLMVTDEDDPRPNLGLRGMPVATDDPDNEGALLAHDVNPYPRHTVLSPKILKHLKSLGHDRILVRSPIVGGSPEGGVYARDVGVREYGTIPGKGEQVGLSAAQALSEPISQGMLSAKHTGGVAGQAKTNVGFPAINAQIQVPETIKGGAAHAHNDGTVSRIEEAPAGGTHVWIDGKPHYVASGLNLKVKPHDHVEAGDVLSEGIPNHALVVQHKGIGEGRRYFMNALRETMTDSGMRGHRRNIELIARGLINHVRLTDEYAGHVPDDLIPYSTLEHTYEPRDGHEVTQPKRAVGKYLEKPVLHYTIGTKVRPSVVKELDAFGVKDVTVHHDPPPFEPEMIRGIASLQADPDWMTRMYGSGLKGSLLDAVHRGASSNELGTSFVPSLARAVDFGRTGLVRSPEQGHRPEDIAVRKPTDKPTHALDIQPMKKAAYPLSSAGVGFDAALNKLDALAEAQIVLAKVAAEMTKAANSSTTGPDGKLINSAGQANHVAPPPRAGVNRTPGSGAFFGKPPTGANQKTPAPAPAQPATTNQRAAPAPAPESEPSEPSYAVHPERQQMAQGMFTGMHNQEQMQDFIHGSRDYDDSESGQGGSMGKMVRMLSGLDARGAATLTGGQHAAPARYGQQFSGMPQGYGGRGGLGGFNDGFAQQGYGGAAGGEDGGDEGTGAFNPYEGLSGGDPQTGMSNFQKWNSRQTPLVQAGTQMAGAIGPWAAAQTAGRGALQYGMKQFPKTFGAGAAPLMTPINAAFELGDYALGTPTWMGGEGLRDPTERKNWFTKPFFSPQWNDSTSANGQLMMDPLLQQFGNSDWAKRHGVGDAIDEYYDPKGSNLRDVASYAGAAFNAYNQPLHSLIDFGDEVGTTLRDIGRDAPVGDNSDQFRSGWGQNMHEGIVAKELEAKRQQALASRGQKNEDPAVIGAGASTKHLPPSQSHPGIGMFGGGLGSAVADTPQAVQKFQQLQGLKPRPAPMPAAAEVHRREADAQKPDPSGHGLITALQAKMQPAKANPLQTLAPGPAAFAPPAAPDVPAKQTWDLANDQNLLKSLQQLNQPGAPRN